MPKLEKESKSETDDPADIAKLVRQQLDSLRNAGLTHLPKGTGEYGFEISEPEQSGPNTGAQKPPQGSDRSSVGEANPGYQSKPVAGSAPESVKSNDSNPDPQPSPPSPSPTLLEDAYGPSLDAEARESALKVLQNEVAGCTKCEELASTRSQTVFGVGNPSARLVFLGEGPGANEDRVGEPFVGEAGQLLDKIMGACNLSRSDVYILNTVKCRPPSNRNPSQDELANCWGYAERQLEILQPEFICCLGSVASRTLLKTTLSIGKLRRQFHSYRGSRVLVTYHPAYLLRTPSAKKHVWEDMKLLMKEMGVDLSK